MSAGPQITWDAQPQNAASQIKWDQPPQKPTAWQRFQANLGTGIGEAALDVYQPLRHPIDTAVGLVKTLGGTQPLAEQARAQLEKPGLLNKAKAYGLAAASGVPVVGPAVAGLVQETAENPVAGLTHGALNLATLKLTPEVLRETARVPGAVRESAMEPVPSATLKALGVTEKSPLAKRTLNAADVARPYLKGARTVAEAQQRLVDAKTEVWAPRQEVIDRFGTDIVDGPDGPATLRTLEAERKELSAINRGIRTGKPGALELAKQKGLTVADSLRREDALNRVIDPAIRSHGIDSLGVRKTTAALSRVQDRLEGRLALSNAPMGFGKLVRGARVGAGVGESGEFTGHGAFISEPLYRFGAAARDIAAGRGLFKGKPADIGIREAFRSGGAKPQFGQVALPPVRLALPPATTVLGREGEIGGPSFVRGIEAKRMFGRGEGGRFKRVYTSEPR